MRAKYFMHDNYKKWSLRLILLVVISPICNNIHAQQNNVKDSTVKYFYDASANILDKQSNDQAKYYRLINYKNGNISGPVKDYFMSGKLMMTGHYLNNSISRGNENGKFVWYYENGKVFQTCNYVNGILNGPYVEFYPSGLKKALITYLNGNRYGCEYAWDEEGTVTHRAFMEENGSLHIRYECDTAYIDKVSQMGEQEVGLKDIFLKEYADGEYKEIGNAFFYKSKGIEILSVSLLNMNMDSISPSNITPGTISGANIIPREGIFFRLNVNVTGLTLNKDNMCDCIVKEQNVEPNGIESGSTGSLYSTGVNGTLEIRLGASAGYAENGKIIPNKDYYLFFDVRDKNSKAFIHGFYRYKVRL